MTHTMTRCEGTLILKRVKYVVNYSISSAYRLRMLSQMLFVQCDLASHPVLSEAASEIIVINM